jgi:hypothetical protein
VLRIEEGKGGLDVRQGRINRIDVRVTGPQGDRVLELYHSVLAKRGRLFQGLENGEFAVWQSAETAPQH